MKRNFWPWTVIIVSFMYCLLFWYSQALSDGSEVNETPPSMSEGRSSKHVDSSTGKHAVSVDIRT